MPPHGPGRLTQHFGGPQRSATPRHRARRGSEQRAEHPPGAKPTSAALTNGPRQVRVQALRTRFPPRIYATGNPLGAAASSSPESSKYSIFLKPNHPATTLLGNCMTRLFCSRTVPL